MEDSRILVDADGCPVVPVIEQQARKFKLPVILFCDTSHVMKSDYCDIYTVSKGKDAADFALVSFCRKGDIVITQDYGVAAMALGKGAFCLNQNGMAYTEENMDALLFERYLANKARRAGKHVHTKHIRSRSEEDNELFRDAIERILQKTVTGRVIQEESNE